MSTPSRPFDQFAVEDVFDRPVERLADAVAAPLRFVAFWAAVALPFLYFPLLFGGLTGGEALAFLSLVGLNVLSLVLGHGYRSH